MKSMRRGSIVLLLLLAVAGCAPSRQEMVRGVDDVVKARLGKSVRWRGDDEKDAAVDAAVARAVGQELTLSTVVDVALLAHPGLQASYASLGLAQADLVDAGLLDNPRFSLSTRFYADTGEPEIEAGLDFPFLQVLFLAQQTTMQEAFRSATEARVVDAVLSVAADARRALVNAVTAQQLAQLAHDDVAAAEIAVIFARENAKAGNLTALDVAIEEAVYEEARLAAFDADRAAAFAAAELGVATGVDGALKIPAALPAVVDVSVGADVVKGNVHVQARRAALDGMAQALGYASATRLVPELDVGVSGELHDGSILVGPSLGVAVPVLNFGQAEVLRRESLVQQEGALLVEDIVHLKARARQASAAVVVTRQRLARIDEALLPARDRVVDEMERRLNGMLITPADLARAHRARFAARRVRAEAVRDAWLAVIDVEQLAMGGTPPESPHLPSPSSSTPTNSPLTPGHD